MNTGPETSEFPIAKALRERIFKIPLLPQDKIIAKFDELDAHLYPHALALTEQFPRLRDYFQEVMFRIASGNTQGKNYYNKEDHEDDGGDPKKKKLLQNSEKRVLIDSFALLRLRDNPKRFCQLTKQAGFLRGVFEEAIELFLELTQGYGQLLEDMHKAARMNSPRYLELERKVRRIENELGFYDSQALATQVIQTQAVWKRYVELREALIAPYFRMVYTLAKGSASPGNDAQTLDNFQNGIFGLVRAVKCYTPTRFAAFSVVAKSWIRQSILLHLKSEVNLIKLPVANWHVYQKLEKIRLGIEQTTQQPAKAEDIAREAKMAVEKVQKVYENAKLVQVLSLNAPTHNEHDQDSDSKWNIESIQSTNDHQEYFELRNEYHLIEKVIHQMDDEERMIFSLISGCFDLISDPNLKKQEILRESIRQKAAKHGLCVIFKGSV
jgi:RNA polymerase sigma factor (sigma-70 family)